MKYLLSHRLLLWNLIFNASIIFKIILFSILFLTKQKIVITFQEFNDE